MTPLIPSAVRSHSGVRCLPCKRWLTWLLTLALAQAFTSATASPGQTYADRAHARAVVAFRQGQFPEAYGRFIDLADAGHPPSARYALWMCEHGLALFGKDWDCAPHQTQDWARAANVVPPRIGAQSYASPAATPATRKTRQ